MKITKDAQGNIHVHFDGKPLTVKDEAPRVFQEGSSTWYFWPKGAAKKIGPFSSSEKARKAASEYQTKDAAPAKDCSCQH